MSMSDKRRAECDLACETAEQFIKTFYDRLDTKRHLIGKLYLDTAVISWNGNKIQGNECLIWDDSSSLSFLSWIPGAAELQKFMTEKLPATEHELMALDAQPVLSEAVVGQTTIVVTTAGSVRFLNSKSGKVAKNFQHSFILTAQGEHWKVASETFRYKDPTVT